MDAFLLSQTPLDIMNALCKDFLALAIGGLTHDAQGARMPVAKQTHSATKWWKGKTMATHIKRNPFARETLMRKSAREIHNIRSGETCRECGGPARYAYKWERDSIGYNCTPYTGMFCTVGCYRAFTGDYR